MSKYIMPTHLKYAIKCINGPELVFHQDFTKNTDPKGSNTYALHNMLLAARYYSFAYYMWMHRDELMSFSGRADSIFASVYTKYRFFDTTTDGEELLYYNWMNVFPSYSK